MQMQHPGRFATKTIAVTALACVLHALAVGVAYVHAHDHIALRGDGGRIVWGQNADVVLQRNAAGELETPNTVAVGKVLVGANREDLIALIHTQSNQISALTNAVAALTERVARTEAALTQSNTTLNAQLAAAKAQTETLAARTLVTEQNVATATSRVATVESATTTQSGQITALNNGLSAVTSRVSGVEGVTATHSGQISSVTNGLSSTNGAVSALSGRVDGIRMPTRWTTPSPIAAGARQNGFVPHNRPGVMPTMYAVYMVYTTADANVPSLYAVGDRVLVSYFHQPPDCCGNWYDTGLSVTSSVNGFRWITGSQPPVAARASSSGVSLSWTNWRIEIEAIWI